MKSIHVASPFNLVVHGEYLRFAPGQHEVEDHIAEHAYVQNFLRKEGAQEQPEPLNKDEAIAELKERNANLHNALESAAATIGRLNEELTATRSELVNARIDLELANERISQLSPVTPPGSEEPVVDAPKKKSK